MILRKLFYFLAASALAAGTAVPASAQIFSSPPFTQATPSPALAQPRAARTRSGPPVAQAAPNPQPRPPHLKGKLVPLVPAPVAGIPAAFAAPTPAPATMIPVESPAASPAAEPVPAPTASIEPAAATEPAAPASVEAVPPAESAEPGAPLDLAAPAAADAPTVVAAVPAGAASETQTIAKVNTYFNGIRTLVGNFTQVGPDGSRADGKFFLQKPGKVRFYYQRPSTTDIIADGKSLVVRDRKLATQDVYPLNQTPLKFLLDTNLDLARDSKVVAVYEEPGLVSVAIEEETTFGGKARVLIVFATADQKTFELKQWTITDPQGLDTTVALSELDTATRPDEKLFAVDYKRDITRN